MITKERINVPANGRCVIRAKWDSSTRNAMLIFFLSYFFFRFSFLSPYYGATFFNEHEGDHINRLYINEISIGRGLRRGTGPRILNVMMMPTRSSAQIIGRVGHSCRCDSVRWHKDKGELLSLLSLEQKNALPLQYRLLKTKKEKKKENKAGVTCRWDTDFFFLFISELDNDNNSNELDR